MLPVVIVNLIETYALDMGLLESMTGKIKHRRNDNGDGLCFCGLRMAIERNMNIEMGDDFVRNEFPRLSNFLFFYRKIVAIQLQRNKLWKVEWNWESAVDLGKKTGWEENPSFILISMFHLKQFPLRKEPTTASEPFFGWLDKLYGLAVRLELEVTFFRYESARLTKQLQ